MNDEFIVLIFKGVLRKLSRLWKTLVVLEQERAKSCQDTEQDDEIDESTK